MYSYSWHLEKIATWITVFDDSDTSCCNALGQTPRAEARIARFLFIIWRKTEATEGVIYDHLREKSEIPHWRQVRNNGEPEKLEVAEAWEIQRSKHII